MFGENRVFKCPYCGTVWNVLLGITDFYEYEGRLTTIQEHCNQRFLGEGISPISVDVRDCHPWQHMGWWNLNVFWNLILENIALGSENEILDKIYPDLCNYYGKETVIKDLESIKAIIKNILEQIDSENIYSEPLTLELEKKLQSTRHFVICL